MSRSRKKRRLNMSGDEIAVNGDDDLKKKRRSRTNENDSERPMQRKKRRLNPSGNEIAVDDADVAVEKKRRCRSDDNDSGGTRDTLHLDPSDASVFLDKHDVQGNMLVHSTSPEAFESIVKDGMFKGSISSHQQYDGWPRDVTPPPAVFFAVHPSTDGVIFPFSRYPRALPEGEKIKLLSIDASTLLDDKLCMFYIASTPTQYGPEFHRVFQTHVCVVRSNDRESLKLAREHFTLLDKRRNALFDFDGDCARIATRVRVGGTCHPNAVMVSFLGNVEYKSNEVDVTDGTKIAFRQGKVSCPFEKCVFRSKSTFQLKEHFRAVHFKVRMFACTHDAETSATASVVATSATSSVVATSATVSPVTKSATTSPVTTSESASATTNDETTSATTSVTPSTRKECGKRFFQRGDLCKHIAGVHAKQRPHRCAHAQCDSAFQLIGGLRFHVASVHRKERPHRCAHAECDQRFAQKSELSKHVANVHEERRSHSCPQCDRSFSQKGHMTEHVARVHAQEEMRFRCERCEKSFFDKGDLTKHVARVHRKERPHRCPHCEKCFSQKVHMDTHVASVHLKARPHRCEVPTCGKSFSQTSTLRRHFENVHRKERSHRCVECGKTFSQNASLKRHAASAHKH